MNYSELIKSIRQTLNLSQEDLARYLEVSFATINRWETGKNKPSKMAVKQIEFFCKDKGIELFKEGD